MSDKQKTAEWLAENVLGFVFEDGFWEHETGINGIVLLHKVIKYPEDQINPEQFIYSPEGVFAVWAAVDKKWPLLNIQFSFTNTGDNCCLFDHTEIEEEDERWGHNAFGKDRYEAFYSAVKEAWEGE